MSILSRSSPVDIRLHNGILAIASFMNTNIKGGEWNDIVRIIFMYRGLDVELLKKIRIILESNGCISNQICEKSTIGKKIAQSGDRSVVEYFLHTEKISVNNIARYVELGKETCIVEDFRYTIYYYEQLKKALQTKKHNTINFTTFFITGMPINIIYHGACYDTYFVTQLILYIFRSIELNASEDEKQYKEGLKFIVLLKINSLLVFELIDEDEYVNILKEMFKEKMIKKKDIVNIYSSDYLKLPSVNLYPDIIVRTLGYKGINKKHEEWVSKQKITPLGKYIESI